MTWYDELSLVLNVVQAVQLLFLIWLTLRERRRVAIVVRNLADGARLELARLPARQVSRAEVLGLVAQFAHGERLDFSRWRFDAGFADEVVVDLPNDSFRMVLAGAPPE